MPSPRFSNMHMGPRPSSWRVFLEGLQTQDGNLAWSIDPAMVDQITPGQADLIAGSLRTFLMTFARKGRPA